MHGLRKTRDNFPLCFHGNFRVAPLCRMWQDTFSSISKLFGTCSPARAIYAAQECLEDLEARRDRQEDSYYVSGRWCCRRNGI